MGVVIIEFGRRWLHGAIREGSCARYTLER
jgi:hypothetical protein